MILIDICKECENETIIVNRTHKLCDNCNYIRLHGMSKYEAAKQKLENGGGVKKVSDKQKLINKSMDRMKAAVSEENKDNRCAGCIRTDMHLDRSHILSIAQRKDLQLDPRNIELLCRNCHEKWESGDINKMTHLVCFTHSMRYIFRMDSETFMKIRFKIEDRANEQRFKYLLDILDSFEEYFCNKFENGKELCNAQCHKCSKV